MFLDASELFAGEQVRTDLIAELARHFPTQKLIYALSVVVIPGVPRD